MIHEKNPVHCHLSTRFGSAAYFAFIHYVPFSEGYRSSELIKFSRKGVLVKTWEGQISQGISGANIFSFSVQGKETDVIEKMKEYQGHYVKVTYKERYATLFGWAIPIIFYP